MKDWTLNLEEKRIVKAMLSGDYKKTKELMDDCNNPIDTFIAEWYKAKGSFNEPPEFLSDREKFTHSVARYLGNMKEKTLNRWIKLCGFSSKESLRLHKLNT